jgi:hypothetical protein
MKSWQEEKMACHEVTKVCLKNKEPTLLEVQSVAVHEEVPKEEAAVENFGVLKKWYRVQYAAVRHRGQPKKRTQSSGRSRKKLVAACRRMPHRAIPARRKGYGRRGPGRDIVEIGAPKGRTSGTRRRAKPESITGIRNEGSRQRLCLRSKTTLGRFFRKTIELEIVKRTVGSSVRLGKMNDRTLWKGRPPPKRKKSLLAALE